MVVIICINIAVLSALATAVVIGLLLRRQKEAVHDQLQALTARLAEMEHKLDTLCAAPSAEGKAHRQSKSDGKGDKSSSKSEAPAGPIPEAKASVDLSAMDDAQLFAHLSSVIREQEMYRWPDLNRTAVMEHFSLPASRVGSAFAKGGGIGLPEFVRNCRLDYACRLMVRQPEMSFIDVSEASGFQRSTTFFHDFKARFGMAPSEYREQQINSKQ